MQKFRSFIALLLLAVVSFAIVPKEFLHAFHDHKDTVHTNHHGNVALEPVHIHCPIFNAESSAFVNETNDFDFTSTTLTYFHSVYLPAAAYTAAVPHTALRGPPAC